MTEDSGKFHIHPGGWMLLALAVCLIIFVAWGIYKAAFPPKPPLQGEMEARTLSVASKTPGRVGKVLVKEGDNVTKGQVLAEMLLPDLEAKLAQAQAQERAAQERESLIKAGPRTQEQQAAKAKYDALEAEAQLAQKTWQRIRALYNDGLVSAEKHDQAKAAAQAAEQEAQAAREEYELVRLGARSQEKAAAEDVRQEAKAGVAQVESFTDDRELRAPRDAEVDKVLLVEGELTAAGFPIITLVDTADQWVTFNILENDMPGIEIGKELTASIPALNQQDVIFTIYYISPRANYATWRSTREDSGYDMKTFEVRARPAKYPAGLRPGMSVLVSRK